MNEEQKQIVKDFKAAVNMTPAQIEKWLGTDESRAVGYKADGEERSESVGHKSGKRIAEILEKKQGDYTDDDFEHMKKVVGYVHRHSARRPGGDITETHWRYSLMNWGHDPKR